MVYNTKRARSTSSSLNGRTPKRPVWLSSSYAKAASDPKYLLHVIQLVPELQTRYTGLKSLAEGGQACIFLAHDNQKNDEVVLRVYHQVKDSIKHYIKEARFAEQLQDSNHVAVSYLDDSVQLFPGNKPAERVKTAHHYKLPAAAYKQQPILIIPMKVYAGDLYDFIQENQENLQQTFADVKDQCLAALNYVHANKFVHADVSPGNFLWDKETGRFVISDLGMMLRFQDPTNLPRGKDKRCANKHSGTSRYFGYLRIVPTAQDGYCNAFRDDIESLANVLYELYVQKLPWRTQKKPPTDDNYDFSSKMVELRREMYEKPPPPGLKKKDPILYEIKRMGYDARKAPVQQTVLRV